MTKPKHEHVKQVKIYLTPANEKTLAIIGEHLGARSTSATVRKLIELFESELVLTYLPNGFIVGNVTIRRIDAPPAQGDTRPD